MTKRLCEFTDINFETKNNYSLEMVTKGQQEV